MFEIVVQSTSATHAESDEFRATGTDENKDQDPLESDNVAVADECEHMEVSESEPEGIFHKCEEKYVQNQMYFFCWNS